MSYVKMGGKLYDMPDDFTRARADAERLQKLGNDALDAICLIAAVALFALFVWFTLSLG